MSLPAEVWNNVTPAQYDALVEKAQENGIPIVGESGQAQKMGVAVMWSYADETLTIQVMNAPFFISEETVAKDIAAMVDGVLAQ